MRADKPPRTDHTQEAQLNNHNAMKCYHANLAALDQAGEEMSAGLRLDFHDALLNNLAYKIAPGDWTQALRQAREFWADATTKTLTEALTNKGTGA